MSRGFDIPAPPPRTGGGGGGGNFPEHGFYETVQYKGKDSQNRVFTWFVKRGGKDKPIMLLDGVDGARVSRYIHDFTGRDGKWGNKIVSLKRGGDDVRVDPMTKALGKEPSWYWCLSGIDMSKTTSKSGKIITNTRCLVLVTEQQKDDMVALEEKDPEGFRFRMFDVSRSSDKTSFRIGTTWFPTGKLSQKEAEDRFSEAADEWGLPIEEFLRPFDYGKVLAAPTFEQMEKYAREYKGEEGTTGGGSEGGSEGDEGEINF